MPRRRHRAEPARRLLPRLPRPVIAVGIGAVLLSVVLGVTFWLNTDSAPVANTVITTDDGQRDTALALRNSERLSRNGSRPPTASVTQPPTVVGQLWATTDVLVRSGPSTDHDRIGTLKAVTQIDVTGATAQGWTQVVTDGRTGWIKSTYLSESKPEPPGLSDAPCSISPEIEADLTANARKVYRSVCATYGSSVSSFIGYRAGDSGDHGSGKAVDIMVSGEPGWEIARFVQAHAGELGVTYVIYQQRIWMAGDPTSAWELMEDRGSTTANHYDHVHVSVS